MKGIRASAVLHLIGYQLNDFEEYINLVTRLIRGEQHDFNRWFEKATEAMSQEEGSEFAEHYADDFHTLSDAFPSIFCESVVMSIWSYFEQEMLMLCRHDIRREAGIGVDTSDDERKIRYLDSCVSYWSVRAIAMPASWPTIENIRDVRNQLAHEGGRRDGTDRSKRVDAFVEAREVAGKGGLSISRDRLVVKPEFCHEMLDIVRAFFGELVPTLP